jgi:hypothetical protein
MYQFLAESAAHRQSFFTDVVSAFAGHDLTFRVLGVELPVSLQQVPDKTRYEIRGQHWNRPPRHHFPKREAEAEKNHQFENALVMLLKPEHNRYQQHLIRLLSLVHFSIREGL